METFSVRPATAAGQTHNRIVVRTYDSAPLSDADRAQTLSVTASILTDAGVDVRWVACGPLNPANGSDPCRLPLASTDLAVRFIQRPPTSAPRAREVTLGYSLLDTHAPFAALATIYVERVEQLVAGCGVPWTKVLGRAVAHEIGHLLLGTSDHAPTGLMRAVWTRDMIERDRATDFRFTDADARALLRSLDARSAGVVPAQIVLATE